MALSTSDNVWQYNDYFCWGWPNIDLAPQNQSPSWMLKLAKEARNEGKANKSANHTKV